MDTIEITRFCLNPKTKRRAGVAHETWLVDADEWVRGAVSTEYAGLLASLSPQATQAYRLTPSGMQALGANERPSPEQARPLPWEEEDEESAWVPAIPTTFAHGGVESRGPRVRRLRPFQSMAARAAQGW